MAGPGGFLFELRRRNVLRAAVLYAGAVWALAQGISQLTPALGLPDWATRWFLFAAIIGFPFWFAFAWFYQLSPHGIKRESDIPADDLITHSGARKLDFAIIGVLAIAVVSLLTNTFVWRNSAGLTKDGASTFANNPAKSIAVLPFVNMSGDPKNDYFSDGITEEILDALAQVPNLKVAARTSAFAFKGRAEDLRKVGEVLDVATVLEGSVQKSDDEVRITAQLIDTHSGYHLWSEKYDRKLTSIFAIEDEISRAIADKLQVQLAGGSGQSPVAQKTIDPRAHELYLRGLTLLAARGPGLRDAADTFRQAVSIDPEYAQAWAGLAQAEVLSHNWHYDADSTAMEAADSAVQRALELDPNVAAAHVALCIIHDERWEWADAERECQRAVQLAPGDAEALDQYAQFLHDTGNSLTALPVIERANRLDPLSGLIGGVHAMVLSDLRRCGPAKTQVDRTLAVAPDSQFARAWAMVRALDCRDYVDAKAQARRLASLIGSSPDTYIALVQGVADPAHRAETLRVLGTLHAPEIRIARWRILLGDREGALAALESAVGELGDGVAQHVWGATFDPIRNDPRFEAVLKKMGLPYVPQDAVKP